MCRLVELETNYGLKIKVADIKKVCVQNIIEAAPQCRQISEIILFGSALEERCTERSDVDIAIISKRGVSGLSGTKGYEMFMNRLYECNKDQEYDRIYFKSVKEIEEKKDTVLICRELLEKGELIYRRA